MTAEIAVPDDVNIDQVRIAEDRLVLGATNRTLTLQNGNLAEITDAQEAAKLMESSAALDSARLQAGKNWKLVSAEGKLTVLQRKLGENWHEYPIDVTQRQFAWDTALRAVAWQNKVITLTPQGIAVRGSARGEVTWLSEWKNVNDKALVYVFADQIIWLAADGDSRSLSLVDGTFQFVAPESAKSVWNVQASERGLSVSVRMGETSLPMTMNPAGVWSLDRPCDVAVCGKHVMVLTDAGLLIQSLDTPTIESVVDAAQVVSEPDAQRIWIADSTGMVSAFDDQGWTPQEDRRMFEQLLNRRRFRNRTDRAGHSVRSAGSCPMAGDVGRVSRSPPVA